MPHTLINDNEFRVDNVGRIVDFSSGDGGDTLNREGQFACLTGKWNFVPPFLCVYDDNLNLRPVRNGGQFPWNNWKNVSRDQLTPFVSALHLTFGPKKNGPNPICKEIYKSLSGKYFAPNIERDAPGTRKYPWPHKFINDKGQAEFRWFDYADVLRSPLRYLIATLDGKKRPFSFAKAWVSLLISVLYRCLVTTRKNPDRADDWQMLCLCMVIEPRFISLYKKLHSKGSMYSVEKYWLGWRKERGFANLWIQKLESYK